MANICKTIITINAEEDAMDWFEALVENFSDDDYVNHFGGKDGSFIERVGCKWFMKLDEWREEEDEYHLEFESAWYPPDVLIKNIVNQLQKRDKFAYASGRYWDECYNPIGIFQCNSLEMFETAETSINVDESKEFYWDEEVEPAFEKLEL